MADEEKEEERILRYYFYSGFQYDTILHFLERFHSLSISKRTLLRKFEKLNLKRRGVDIDIGAIRNHIEEEVEASAGQLRGYRSIWHTLRHKHNLQVPRRIVALLLHDIDPEQSAVRRSRKLVRRSYLAHGPNFSWHVDGYDKLKPYGLPIHGAIDGYSRKILWLKVVPSNNLPIIPAMLYLDCVRDVQGCPVLLRTDGGSENVLMAGAQCFFRRNDTDPFYGNKAHRKGTSPSNQRIECWWSIFRRGSSSYWIDFFKNLCDEGYLDRDNKLHMEFIWFCFSLLLQNFLDDVKEHWNTHRIRNSASSVVSGIPNVLYFMPQESGGVECKCSAPSLSDIAQVESYIDSNNVPEDQSDAARYMDYLVRTQNLAQPTSMKDAYDLYIRLIQVATNSP